jgi:hypothetical protein
MGDFDRDVSAAGKIAMEKPLRSALVPGALVTDGVLLHTAPSGRGA